MALAFPDPLALLVSLPRNDVELARAAVAAGADGLKVHVNVEHRASGTSFGTVREERGAIEAIVGLGVPVGAVVGGEGRVEAAEVAALRELGVAFVDVYLHHAPPWYVAAAPADGALVALAHDQPLELAAGLRRLGVTAVEASLAAPEEYGTPLTLARVAQIARLVELAELPVVVPSQHALRPDDVAALGDAGCAAVLIGAVVTGTEAAQVGEVTAAFRAAIDRWAQDNGRGRDTSRGERSEGEDRA